MGAPDFILDPDAAFASQLRTTLAVVSADPAAYGLSPAIVAELQAALDALESSLRDQQLKIDAARAATTQNDADRAAAERVYRTVNALAQANPAVPADRKVKAGLPERRPPRARVPAPDATPILVVEGHDRLALRVRVLFPNHPKGGRPAGVESVAVFTFTGAAAPADLAAYAWQGNHTRSRLTLKMPPEAARQTVWIVAVPMNARGEHGPMSPTIAATVAA